MRIYLWKQVHAQMTSRDVPGDYVSDSFREIFSASAYVQHQWESRQTPHSRHSTPKCDTVKYDTVRNTTLSTSSLYNFQKGLSLSKYWPALMAVKQKVRLGDGRPLECIRNVRFYLKAVLSVILDCIHSFGCMIRFICLFRKLNK